jgi:hypothetical protein
MSFWIWISEMGLEVRHLIQLQQAPSFPEISIGAILRRCGGILRQPFEAQAPTGEFKR